MNLMNKIYGKRFAVVQISEIEDGNKLKYMVAPTGPGIQWHLTEPELAEYELDSKVVEDMIKELEKLGTMEELTAKMGLPNNAGWHYSGIVLRHPKRPQILCALQVFSGPRVGYNPNNYNWDCDIIFELFYDVENLGSVEIRPEEEEYKMMYALSNHHTNGMGYLEIEDEIQEVEEIDAEPEEEEVNDDAKPDLVKESRDDYRAFTHDFYSKLTK